MHRFVVGITSLILASCHSSAPQPPDTKANDGSTEVAGDVGATDTGADLGADVTTPDAGCRGVVDTADRFAARRWVGCGVGCSELSPLVRPGYAVAPRAYAGLQVVGADVLARLDSGNSGGARTSEVLRMSDGTTVASLSGINCPTATATVLALVHVTESAGVLIDDLKWVQPPAFGVEFTEPLARPPAATGSPVAQFSLIGAYGVAWASGMVAVRSKGVPSSGWTQLEPSGSGPAEAVATLDDQLVYVQDKGPTQVFRSYRTGGKSPVTLFESTGGRRVASVALSADRIGYLDVEPGDTFSTLVLRVGKRSDAAGGFTPTDVTGLKGYDSGGIGLAIYGDYAVTQACNSGLDTCDLVIVRISDKSTWRFPARAGRLWSQIFAAGPDYLVSAEAMLSSRAQLATFVRLDLTMLDAARLAWGK